MNRDATDRSSHVDGSICRAGTRQVPPNFVPCCAVFGGHVDTCVYDIRYEWWSKEGYWVIAVPDGGPSGITIAYCPHCGSPLTRTPYV